MAEIKEPEWISYNELAWTEHIIAPPEMYEEDAMILLGALAEKRQSVRRQSLLHLGCGAGGHDFFFKRYYTVMGVDISEGMLEIARKTNPEVVYIKGDMRNVIPGKKFDVVVIPDSIMYMTTTEDLEAVVRNASAHLKKDGLFLVVAHMKDDFRNNNFAYSAQKGDLHITVLENNHIVSVNTYEAVFTYLIRNGSELTIKHEVHTLGLFSYLQWREIFDKYGFEADEMDLDDLYDKNMLGEGEYRLKIFVGKFRNNPD